MRPRFGNWLQCRRVRAELLLSRSSRLATIRSGSGIPSPAKRGRAREGAAMIPGGTAIRGPLPNPPPSAKEADRGGENLTAPKKKDGGDCPRPLVEER